MLSCVCLLYKLTYFCSYTADTLVLTLLTLTEVLDVITSACSCNITSNLFSNFDTKSSNKRCQSVSNYLHHFC